MTEATEPSTARSLARDAAALAFFLTLCSLVAGLGGYWTSLSVGEWYGGLRKPSFQPPAWVFGPVWTALYAAMAIAAWLVWRRGERSGRKTALALFGVQLALNLAWSGLFFGLRSPGAAFGEILFLWAAILATLVAFWRISRPAGLLLVPYQAWVTFASVLNFAIWRLNS